MRWSNPIAEFAFVENDSGRCEDVVVDRDEQHAEARRQCEHMIGEGD
jgi:hypothetical protein